MLSPNPSALCLQKELQRQDELSLYLKTVFFTFLNFEFNLTTYLKNSSSWKSAAAVDVVQMIASVYVVLSKYL